LPFGFKARDDRFGVHAELDDLQRDASADGLGLLGDVNDPAAAFTHFFEEFVAVDACADGFFVRVCDGFRRFGRSVKKSGGRLVGAKELLDLGAKRWVPGAGGVQIRRTTLWRIQFESAMKNVFGLREIHTLNRFVSRLVTRLLPAKRTADEQYSIATRLMPRGAAVRSTVPTEDSSPAIGLRSSRRVSIQSEPLQAGEGGGEPLVGEDGGKQALLDQVRPHELVAQERAGKPGPCLGPRST
jgi:hypothetical protein